MTSSHEPVSLPLYLSIHQPSQLQHDFQHLAFSLRSRNPPSVLHDDQVDLTTCFPTSRVQPPRVSRSRGGGDRRSESRAEIRERRRRRSRGGDGGL
jgi:hypothetical protein